MKKTAEKEVAVQRQKKTITGTIIDTTGVSIIGANIIEVGTTNGTVTDINGRFILDVEVDAIIRISYIGYLSQDISTVGKTNFNIVLQEDSEALEEVVVVGYGKQKKISITGSIASIQTKEIKQSPAANLAVSLAGRLPGLTAIQRSGEPGRDATQLVLRGLGTVNGQTPIILVDGIERDLTYVDPNEVESITILKDASATAVYGVRGANGVILVTTRRGTSSTPEIGFTAEVSVQDFPRFVKPVNSYGHAILTNLVLENDGQEKRYSARDIEMFRTGEDPVRYPNTNWRKELINDYAIQQRYNLNVTGKANFVKYFVNAGYLNQGGMFKTEKGLPYDPSFKLDRYSFRSNIDIDLSKKLSTYLNIAGYLEKQNMPQGVLHILGGDLNANLSNNSPAWHILAYMNDLPPTLPGTTTPEGEVLTTETVPNPAFGQLNRSGYAQQNRNNVTATYGMEYDLKKITEGLSIKGELSFDASSTNNLFASRSYERYVQVIDKNIPDSNGMDSVYYRRLNDIENTPLTIRGGNSYSQYTNFRGYLNYHRLFGKHDLTGLLLYQRQKIVHGQELPYNLEGFAARVGYNYDNRYFTEINAGYNGSEQFAKGNRFGFFPAISGAWVLSNEEFLYDNSFLTHLKLRASYGKVGNDRIGGTRFLYLDDISVVSGGLGSLGKGQLINIALFGNRKLTWEVAKKTNIGIDIEFLNSISINMDFFHERRNNILRRRNTIPSLNGFSMGVLPPANIGIIENKGYEIELIYKKSFTQDLFFYSKFNVNYARNKQIFADEPLLPEEYAYRYRQTGYRIGQPFVYIVEGYFNDEEEILNSPIQNVGGRPTKPGDFRYKDANKDGVIDERDRVPYGYSSVPEYTFASAFSIQYKSWDLSLLFQGVTNVSNFYADRGTHSKFFFVERHLESWTKERAENGHRISYPRLTGESSPNEILNSFFLEDASYIRLKNAELGYTLPKRMVKNIGPESIRVYFNGFNLYTWDRLSTKNFDPEIPDSFTYPNTRLFNFGINIIF
ncbi:TonB-dependent receptor [Proteiniphilum sp.]|uniref:SusC/RagA family TonB-linked outer membrane protein n=1 Tax=Proteiniphilum sp. TaxID=1926877 RepID=UPI00331D3098